MQDGVCAGGHLHHECCAIRPSPTRLRVDAGYPYTLDLSPNANATTSVARSWVYGGAGYAVSRGLMNSVERPKWKRCVDQAICGNADQRVTRCVLNLGWAFTDPSRDTEPPWKGGLRHHLGMSNNRNRGSRLLRRGGGPGGASRGGCRGIQWWVVFLCHERESLGRLPETPSVVRH